MVPLAVVLRSVKKFQVLVRPFGLVLFPRRYPAEKNKLRRKLPQVQQNGTEMAHFFGVTVSGKVLGVIVSG